MATFTQWSERADKGEVKKATWICGDERVLVDEVVARVTTALKPGPFDLVTLTVGEAREKDVWAALNQYPIDIGNRLTIIRNADKITKWEQFESWLEDSRRMPTCYAVLVSNERDFPYNRDDDGKKQGLPSYIEKGRGKMHLVRCIAPWGGSAKDRNEGKDLIAWAQRYANISGKDVFALMEHCGGNLTRAKSMLDKAGLFGGNMSLASLKLLAGEIPSEDFTNSLLLMDKRRALMALDYLHPDDYSRVIGSLDTNLVTMAKIFAGLARNLTPLEMARDGGIGVSHFLVQKFAPAAKHYDLARRSACRATLALHDVHLRAGARVGLMESLVAAW